VTLPLWSNIARRPARISPNTDEVIRMGATTDIVLVSHLEVV